MHQTQLALLPAYINVQQSEAGCQKCLSMLEMALYSTDVKPPKHETHQ